MFKPSQHSLKQLKTAIPPIRDMYRFGLKHRDIRAECCWRDEATQTEYFNSGKSEVEFPNSYHNLSKIFKSHGNEKFMQYSDAIDISIFVDGKLTFDPKYYIELNGYLQAWADLHSITLIWGGNWDNDQVIMDDQKFQDLMHWQIIDCPRHYSMD